MTYSHNAPPRMAAKNDGATTSENVDFTRRFDLPCLHGKSKCARSHSRQSAKQASRLRFVRDLRGGAAEHPRSHGTAGSAAGKICCMTFRSSDPLKFQFLFMSRAIFQVQVNKALIRNIITGADILEILNRPRV